MSLRPSNVPIHAMIRESYDTNLEKQLLLKIKATVVLCLLHSDMERLSKRKQERWHRGCRANT